MKKLLIFVLLLVTLYSCNTDVSNTTKDTTKVDTFDSTGYYPMNPQPNDTVNN